MPALATYEQSVSPESVAKVPLTGLSFYAENKNFLIREKTGLEYFLIKAGR